MATVEDFKVKVSVDGANKLDQLGSSASAVANKMSGLGAAIIGVGFGAFIHGASQAADMMADLSDATDITLGSIIAFGGALEAAGGKSRNTEKTILALYNAIELAADGGGKQQEAFKKLGISLDDLRNLSEADILNKTISSLGEMSAGSERSAIAATLLSKSFRSVDPAKFGEELAKAKADADKAAVGQQSLADFNQKLEKTFRDLQLAAGEVMGPILDLFNGVEMSSTAAKVAVSAFAGITAVIFGATVIRSIKEFIDLYKTISKVIKSAVVAQTALVALTGPVGWGIIAGAAIAATGAYIALDKAMGDAADTAKEVPLGPTGKPGVENKGPGGPVKREVKAYVSPEAQAALESEKRIAQSQAEFRKLTEMSVTDEIKNIRLGAIADIDKMETDINANKLLNSVQKEKEIAERRKEINKKADFDIMKVRMDVEKQLAEQLKSISSATEERLKAFEIEQKFLGAGSSQLNLQNQLLDIEKKRKDAIETATKAAEKDPSQLQAALQKINENAQIEGDLANKRAEWSRSFSTGWERAFGDYVDNATNAATQAQAIFQTMTSGMNNAIDKFVDTGKFSFSDFTNSIIRDIIKIQMKAAVANLFSASSSFLGFTLPGKALGGPVAAGTPYMVGEKGPEMFIPASSGSITPNNKLNMGSSGQVNISYNIQAVDAISFKQMVARDPSFMYAVTEQGRKSLPATRR